MKNPQDIKQTPRYQQMVATLKSRPLYVQEAALLKELANGRQWRIDAVVEAIDAKKGRWNSIDSTRVFEQAAIYGRLATIKKLSGDDYFGFKLTSPHTCANQILAAFDAAVMHGHYQVADFCKSLGAKPYWPIGLNKWQRAMSWAVKEGNEHKMDYLIKAGINPDHYLNEAVAASNKKSLDFLFGKGADINYERGPDIPPVFLIAIQLEKNELAHYLLKKGADPKNSVFAGEAMSAAIGYNNIEMVKTMIELGIRPDKDDLDSARYRKHQEMIDLLAWHIASDGLKNLPGRNPSP